MNMKGKTAAEHPFSIFFQFVCNLSTGIGELKESVDDRLDNLVKENSELKTRIENIESQLKRKEINEPEQLK